MMRVIILVCSLLPGHTGIASAVSMVTKSVSPPVVVMNISPSRPGMLVYDGEAVLLDSRQSFDPAGGDIVRVRWLINGVRHSTGDTFVWYPQVGHGVSQEVQVEICDARGLCSDDVRVFTISPVSDRFYYLKDHAGSVRATVDEYGNVVHYSDYYPFGTEMPRRVLENESPDERFTGHQLDKGTGLIYAGARYYDADIMRWISPDPAANEYPGWSPYNYALNNPVNNYDPDGRLVVFINGFYADAFPFAKDLVDYWGAYAEDVMSYYPGEDAYFADGSLGGLYGLSQVGRIFSRTYNFLPEDRYRVGYNAGWDQAAGIAARLQKDETIKVFSHSMGGSFGAGFASALQAAGLDVEFHLAIAPFQSTSIEIGGVATYQVGDMLDPVAWYPSIDGAVSIPKTRSDDPYSWYRFRHRLVRRHLLADYDARFDVERVQKEQEEEMQNRDDR